MKNAEPENRKEADYHYQFAAQQGSLSRRIYKKYGVDVDDLRMFSDIFLVYLEKETVVSKLSAAESIFRKAWNNFGGALRLFTRQNPCLHIWRQCLTQDVVVRQSMCMQKY